MQELQEQEKLQVWMPQSWAVRQAQENARLNGLEGRVKFICEDVFELLPKLAEDDEKYDVVILDPPAFTKSRSSHQKCGQRLQRNQSSRYETGQGRRISGNLFLLTFHGL